MFASRTVSERRMILIGNHQPNCLWTDHQKGWLWKALQNQVLGASVTNPIALIWKCSHMYMFLPLRNHGFWGMSNLRGTGLLGFMVLFLCSPSNNVCRLRLTQNSQNHLVFPIEMAPKIPHLWTNPNVGDVKAAKKWVVSYLVDSGDERIPDCLDCLNPYCMLLYVIVLWNSRVHLLNFQVLPLKFFILCCLKSNVCCLNPCVVLLKSPFLHELLRMSWLESPCLHQHHRK